MPLGVREVMILINAKDQASRIVTQVGAAFKATGTDMQNLDADAKKAAASAEKAAKQTMAQGGALLGVGAAMVGIGAAGVAFYSNMAKSAIEYNKEASLTLTQVRETGVGLEQIKDIGKRVGAEIGIPFKQLQTALFDIFSSTDLSAKDAEKALASFSKGAVAGATEVAKASNASISILNGFQLPISELNRVMDVQFKTVQLGRVTYEELASTIGRAIPSANKAGASIEDLSGMLAFLTRNGLSAAMAATSSARAFDLLSNPIFNKNLQALGISALDSKGNFRSMVDVVDDLRKKLSGLNEGDRAKALKDLTFGAGGTIQAMRFLNLAIQDNNGDLRNLTNQVTNSAGAMDAAYKIMADTPAAKLQVLKNNWAILKTEIGDAVIPVVEKMVSTILPLVQRFNDLNPKTKQAIIYAGMIATALTILTGIVVAAAGAIMLLSGAWALLAGGGTALLITFGWIVLAVAAVVAAGYLLYKNWDTVTKFGQAVWLKMQVAWNSFVLGFTSGTADVGKGVGGILGFFLQLGGYAGSLYNTLSSVWTQIQIAWFSFVLGFESGTADVGRNVDGILGFFLRLGGGFGELVNAIQWWFGVSVTVWTTIGAIVAAIWSGFFFPIFSAIGTIITAVVIPAVLFLAQVFGVSIQAIIVIIQVFWTVFSTIATMIANVIWVIIKPAVEFLWPIFKTQFDNIARGAKSFWNDGVMPTFNALKGAWEAIMDAVVGSAKRGFDNTIIVIRAAINGIIDLVNGAINGAGKGLNTIIGVYNKIPGVDHVDNVQLPNIPKLHSGGMVNATAALNNSEVLRVLQIGEGVLSRNAVQNLGGSQGVDALNAGMMPGNSPVVVQAGAIQIIVQGGDGNVQQQVEDAVTNALRKLTNQVKAS